MKAVILAGGLGTRLGEETDVKPKPMVEVGGRPILWHIMKIFSRFGVDDFIICCGYKGFVIKEYFDHYRLRVSDVTYDLASNEVVTHATSVEPWRVTLVDTGDATMTGGRLKRVARYLEGEETFFFTYGDGVSDVNLDALTAFHRAQNRLATITVVQPPGRFGAVNLDGADITSFREKPPGDGSWVNGGFMVLSPQVFDYIAGDETAWEAEPMQLLARDNELCAYKHPGFWHNMDTLWDQRNLERLWNSGQAPWKTWDNDLRLAQAAKEALSPRGSPAK